MGFGASKIDYSERDFEEKPLEEEEIEVLLKALPEENVIDSIDNDGREKILKAMSDQKVFNIRGDNIFDYYLTNKREIIKGCMSNQFNRDGTPCPDEKFNRMITTIPDLVQGPLREKETEWDTEKTNLKSQYDTLDTAKTDLQGKYDTLNTQNTDLQNQHDTLKTSNTDLQNQFDTVKGERDTLTEGCGTATETLTKEKTDLQGQYDTLNTQKTELIKYRDILVTEKGDLESEIQKNLLSNVVRVTDGDNTKTVSEQQCKAYAKSLGTTMGKGNDTSGCYLAPHKEGGYGVYYNKKTGKGKCYYNSDSDYRTCIQNNLNRNNTYSKQSCNGDVGGEYDCRVDGTWDQITVEGWDRNKYGQTLDSAKHFCNTHKDCVAVASSHSKWNWPVHTTSKFKPCNKEYKEVTSGKPDLSVTSPEECMAYAESKGYSYNEYGGTGELDGCWVNKIGPNVYYTPPGKSTGAKTCSDSSRACVQKGNNCDPKMNYHTKQKCKKPIDGVWSKGVGESCEWECPGRSGIDKYTVPKFHVGRAYACSARDYLYDKEKGAHSGGDRKLVQGSKGHFSCRSQGGANFGWASYKHQDDRMTYKSLCSDWDNPKMFYQKVTSGEPSSKYKEVNSGKPNLSVSKEECMQYAIINNKNFSNISNKANPFGCFINKLNNPSNIWYNSKTTSTMACDSNKSCIQKNTKNVSEEQCKAYAIKNNFHDSYDVVEYPNEAPKGCIIRDKVGVRYNKATCLSKCKCGETNWDCIQIK